MSVHVDDLFIAGNPETLKNIKKYIKEKFNISESVKVRNFLGYIMNGVVMQKVRMRKLPCTKT